MLWDRRKARRKANANANAAINIVIIGMVFVGIFGHFTNKKTPSVSLPDAAQEVAKEAVEHAKQAKNHLLSPTADNLVIQDITEGTGAPAICGQTVTVAYQAYATDNSQLDDSATKEKPLSFTIGQHKVMPAFDEGVVGMRIGGVRKFFAPAEYAYGAEGFDKKGLPTDQGVTFEVQLLNITPPLPAPEETSFRAIQNQQGLGPELACGASAEFNVTIWAMDGHKLFTTTGEKAAPLTLTPGTAKHFSGLEIAALGMRPSGKRTMIIPPAYQKRLDKAAETLEIPFPKDQTVLVDIERLQ